MFNKIDKIFISHSTKDEFFVKELINLLHDIGIPKGQKRIFCSSYEPYSVEFTEDILDYIKNEFNKKILVIFILSDNFYNSPICLCEMGATWAKSKLHIPIIIPPFDFNEMEGSIRKTMKGFAINNSSALDNFQKQVVGLLKLKAVPDIGIWNEDKDNFLKEINKHLKNTTTNINQPNKFQNVFENSIVASYSFNENTNDNSNSNHGISFGEINYLDSPYGKAACFNKDSYITVKNSSELNIINNITISVVIKFAENQPDKPGYDWKSIIQKTTYNDAYGLMLFTGLMNSQNQNKILAFYLNGCTFSNSLDNKIEFEWGDMQSNKWYSLICTYNGEFACIYIDYSLVMRNKVTGKINYNIKDIIIGRNMSSDFPYPLRGEIACLKIYNIALDENEIRLISENK